MSNQFVFNAVPRTESGKGGSRRLRRESMIPAVLYGGHAAAELLQFEHNEVTKRLADDAVYSHILTLNIGGRQESAILKAMQRHPSRPIILHMDFQRVSADDKIRVHVPLHFRNEASCVGVKKGGAVMHGMVEVEVICLPAHLPESIEVDLAQMEIGQSLHLSDLKIPSGVQIIALAHGADHDLTVVSVQKIGGGAEEAE